MFFLASDPCVDVMVFEVLLRVLDEEHEAQTFLVQISSLFLLSHEPLAPSVLTVEIIEVLSTISIERDHILEMQ